MHSRIVRFLSEYTDNKYCLLSFIFGSVAKYEQRPNDCDLFWTTTACPDTEQWNEMKSIIFEMKKNFELEFGLQLNVCINTKDEFFEGSEFKSRILERPKIILKNSIQHVV